MRVCLFAYPAGENAAESEPEQERVWKESRRNAQKYVFSLPGAGWITADTMRGSIFRLLRIHVLLSAQIRERGDCHEKIKNGSYFGHRNEEREV